MQQPIRLDFPEALPNELVALLSCHRKFFERNKYLDDILRHTEIQDIAEKLEGFLEQQTIHGYHCTKEPSLHFFETKGLRITDVRTHQAEFLERFGHHFTADEIVEMSHAWERYFVEDQRRARDGRVWVCLSRSLVLDSGTESFFQFFGGEAIHMPLETSPAIMEKLARLGRAVVVEVAIPGKALKANYSMSRAVLSRYHKTIRTDAHRSASVASSRQPVPPADIIRVSPLEEFKSEALPTWPRPASRTLTDQ